MLRLMIVDDEQIIRESLSEMIDYPAIGYELVAVAKNGMEAYDMICDEYPDVVITDIRMPILNGLELIERSLKTDSKISFVLLSGYSEFEYAKQAMRFGVREYLLKPTDKQELIDALVNIRNERIMDAEQKRRQQQELLCSLQAPLEQCFIMEALEYQEDFPAVFHKYSKLLSLPPDHQDACICSFVEEDYAQGFIADAMNILERHQVSLAFPALYVKNSVVLLFQADSLSFQERLQQQFTGLSYPGQSVVFEVRFLRERDTKALFAAIVDKIARYEKIQLFDQAGDVHEIRSNPASPWRIEQLVESLSKLPDEAGQVVYREVLESIFSDSMPLPAAKNIAVSLFLKLLDSEKENGLDIACDFFRRIYCCREMDELKELAQIILMQQKDKEPSKNSANIALLKSYVLQNLGKEDISLKWLAENYLFVSVGYLSKQFLKEEGVRFSDYLNGRRMEEAKRLMEYYHKDNIKDIACRVGFCNNPQYFSQVFKRYTGFTPSEYIENRNN